MEALPDELLVEVVGWLDPRSLALARVSLRTRELAEAAAYSRLRAAEPATPPFREGANYPAALALALGDNGGRWWEALLDALGCRGRAEIAAKPHRLKYVNLREQATLAATDPNHARNLRDMLTLGVKASLYLGRVNSAAGLDFWLGYSADDPKALQQLHELLTLNRDELLLSRLRHHGLTAPSRGSIVALKASRWTGKVGPFWLVAGATLLLAGAKALAGCA